MESEHAFHERDSLRPRQSRRAHRYPSRPSSPRSVASIRLLPSRTGVGADSASLNDEDRSKEPSCRGDAPPSTAREVARAPRQPALHRSNMASRDVRRPSHESNLRAEQSTTAVRYSQAVAESPPGRSASARGRTRYSSDMVGFVDATAPASSRAAAVRAARERSEAATANADTVQPGRDPTMATNRACCSARTRNWPGRRPQPHDHRQGLPADRRTIGPCCEQRGESQLEQLSRLRLRLAVIDPAAARRRWKRPVRHLEQVRQVLGTGDRVAISNRWRLIDKRSLRPKIMPGGGSALPPTENHRPSLKPVGSAIAGLYLAM